MFESIRGRSVLVTGGTKGIGKGIAAGFSNAGAQVVITGRDAPSGAQAAEELTAAAAGVSPAGGKVSYVSGDVSDQASCLAMVAAAVGKHGGLDVVCCNAGIFPASPLAEMTSGELETVLGTNLKGTIFCTKAVSRVMIRQRYGRIINLSSVVGQMGNAGQSLYASTKSGIIGFTKAIARELASRGITVNAVAPGFVETEMTGQLSAKLQEECLRSIPLGRFGNCDEVAELVVFLAGAGAGYITGQVLNVNGGLYM